jgi:hypothetical protein
MLLDRSVLADPYDFYRMLREQAPVWPVPGTEVVTISTFDLLSEAVARPVLSPSRIRYCPAWSCLRRENRSLTTTATVLKSRTD